MALSSSLRPGFGEQCVNCPLLHNSITVNLAALSNTCVGAPGVRVLHLGPQAVTQVWSGPSSPLMWVWWLLAVLSSCGLTDWEPQFCAGCQLEVIPAICRMTACLRKAGRGEQGGSLCSYDHRWALAWPGLRDTPLSEKLWERCLGGFQLLELSPSALLICHQEWWHMPAIPATQEVGIGAQPRQKCETLSEKQTTSKKGWGVAQEVECLQCHGFTPQ
jgi:hypothetical protein